MGYNFFRKGPNDFGLFQCARASCREKVFSFDQCSGTAHLRRKKLRRKSLKFLNIYLRYYGPQNTDWYIKLSVTTRSILWQGSGLSNSNRFWNFAQKHTFCAITFFVWVWSLWKCFSMMEHWPGRIFFSAMSHLGFRVCTQKNSKCKLTASNTFFSTSMLTMALSRIPVCSLWQAQQNIPEKGVQISTVSKILRKNC